jgi:transcriptional repressor NF-X1
MEVSEATSTGTGDTNSRTENSRGGPNAGRNRRHARDSAPRSADIPKTNVNQHAPRRHYGRPRGAGDNKLASGPSISVPGAPAATVSGDSSTLPPPKRNFRTRNSTRPPNTKDASTIPVAGPENSNDKGGPSDRRRPSGGGFRRGAKFNAGLTEPDSATSLVSKPTEKYRSKYNHAKDPETLDDLTSRLIHALRTPPYPDCPICFSPIHPAQPIWSCSPSISIIRPDDAESDEQQYCWTPFHVKCIGSWATKSVKDIADAWRARGEEGRRGDWRCPGCQAKREIVPSGYWYVYYVNFRAYHQVYRLL